jgi:hypothetical protein
MADLLIQPGEGAGPRYASITDDTELCTWWEPPPTPLPAGAAYRRLGAIGDAALLSPVIYTVELSVAEADLPAVFAWYEGEHLAMLAACPGCLGAARYQLIGEGPFNLLAAYRFVDAGVNETAEWDAARSTEWTLRVRGAFRASRRFLRRRIG